MRPVCRKKEEKKTGISPRSSRAEAQHHHETRRGRGREKKKEGRGYEFHCRRHRQGYLLCSQIRKKEGRVRRGELIKEVRIVINPLIQP